MKNETRSALNKYRKNVAIVNGIDIEDTDKKFTIHPTAQQILEEKTQASSEFLSKINVVGVAEAYGERLGLGVTTTLASTTDTNTKDRETQNLGIVDSIKYHCQQINYDSHLTYGQLDQWAKFPDFQQRIANVKMKRIALDRIMIGFNGKSRSPTSDRSANSLLQDVAKGWLEKIRTDAPKRHLKEIEEDTNKIYIGKGQTYQNLDALVFSAVTDLLEPWYHDDPELVAIVGRDLLADKYFPLINNNADKGTEQLAADLVISQKRIGRLPAVTVPGFPAGTVLITRLDNLSIYYQESGMRRTMVDNAKRDRYEDYLSSNDDFVIENYDCVALLENIEMKDK